MQQKNQQQESHLQEIIRLLSMYHALSLQQLEVLFPELAKQKLQIGRAHRLNSSHSAKSRMPASA